MNMLPSILEACEYRMQTTKLLNSYLTEMVENSIFERLIFKIFYRKTLKLNAIQIFIPYLST